MTESRPNASRDARLRDDSSLVTGAHIDMVDLFVSSNEARIPPFFIAISRLGEVLAMDPEARPFILDTKLGIYDKFEPYIAGAAAMRENLPRDDGIARTPGASEELTARLALALKRARLTLNMIDRLEADCDRTTEEVQSAQLASGAGTAPASEDVVVRVKAIVDELESSGAFGPALGAS